MSCLLVSICESDQNRFRPWPPKQLLAQMLARKPKMLVTVALANKMARVIWALLVKGGTYRAPAVAA